MFQDLRYGLPLLLKHLGFMTVATLAFGIGADRASGGVCGKRVVSSSIPGAVRTLAGIPREPDVSGAEIVFLYAGRLWLVPRNGGAARSVGETPPVKSAPKFGPSHPLRISPGRRNSSPI